MNTLYKWEKATEENIPDNKEHYYDEVGCELRAKLPTNKLKDKPKIEPWTDFRYVHWVGR